MYNLKNIRDNHPFKKDKGTIELTRDLICLSIQIDESWTLRVNGENFKGIHLYELSAALLKLEEEKKSKQKGNKIRRLVIWVQSLNFYHHFFKEFKEDLVENRFCKFNKRTGKPEERIQKLVGEHLEFRDFNIMANEEKEWTVEEIENRILGYQNKGLKNWFQLDYSFAHCQLKLFYKRFTREELDMMWKETKEDLRIPPKEFYDVITKKSSKSSLIGFDPGLKLQVLRTVKSFDIRSAFNGQFVRANDFPIGQIHKIEPTWDNVRTLINEDKWFILVMKADQKVPVPSWLDGRFKENNIYEYVIGNYDYLTLRKIGFKLSNFNWKLAAIWTTDKTGYLNKEFRAKIVQLYNEKENLKAIGKTEEAKETKAITEVLYGKGLQVNQYEDSRAIRNKYMVKHGSDYVMPQFSYHALQKTRYELALMLERTGFEWAVAWDTDGIKTINANAEQIFSKRNQEIKKENSIAGFPNTNIGTWKNEGSFDHFIQFSNKVYAYNKEDKLVCKFAGCRKSAIENLIQNTKDIDAFFEWAASGSFTVKDGIRRRVYYTDTLTFKEEYCDYTPGMEEEI